MVDNQYLDLDSGDDLTTEFPESWFNSTISGKTVRFVFDDAMYDMNKAQAYGGGLLISPNKMMIGLKIMHIWF